MLMGYILHEFIEQIQEIYLPVAKCLKVRDNLSAGGILFLKCVFCFIIKGVTLLSNFSKVAVSIRRHLQSKVCLVSYLLIVFLNMSCHIQ